MLTCLVLALGVSAVEMPGLASRVAAEARALAAQTEITPSLLSGIEQFSADSELLSASLREAGVTQDLPCIFHGIAEDARERAAALRIAQTGEARAQAFTELRVLLDDAILIAPMAATAATEQTNAVR